MYNKLGFGGPNSLLHHLHIVVRTLSARMSWSIMSHCVLFDVHIAVRQLDQTYTYQVGHSTAAHDR